MEEFGEIVSQSPRSSVNSWEKGVSIPRKDKLEKIALLGILPLSKFFMVTLNLMFTS